MMAAVHRRISHPDGRVAVRVGRCRTARPSNWRAHPLGGRHPPGARPALAYPRGMAGGTSAWPRRAHRRPGPGGRHEEARRSLAPPVGVPVACRTALPVPAQPASSCSWPPQTAVSLARSRAISRGCSSALSRRAAAMSGRAASGSIMSSVSDLGSERPNARTRWPPNFPPTPACPPRAARTGGGAG